MKIRGSKFLKKENEDNMRGYFIVIALLNVIDALATAGGIKLKAIGEANPIMNFLWQVNPLLFIGVKLLFSFLLLIIVVFLKIQPKNILKWRLFLGSTILIYLWLMILHTRWIVSLVNE
jgi:hypothetical protein